MAVLDEDQVTASQGGNKHSEPPTSVEDEDHTRRPLVEAEDAQKVLPDTAEAFRQIYKLGPALYGPKFFIIPGRSDIKIAFGDFRINIGNNNEVFSDPRYDLMVAVPWETVAELHDQLGRYLNSRAEISEEGDRRADLE